jgi:hypothetical protein
MSVLRTPKPDGIRCGIGAGIQCWRLLLAMLAGLSGVCWAQPQPRTPWRYTLIGGATLTDDCPICGRPAIMLPMDGTFDLVLREENPLFTTYSLENIQWVAGHEGGMRYILTGVGEYQVGGEVAVTQRLTLTLKVDDGKEVTKAEFASEHGAVTRQWPMLLAGAKQTNGTLTRQFDIELAAAPFRALWFSTNHGMTSGLTPPPFEYFRHSDLLALDGHRVKSNAELIRHLGVMPMAPDLGLDAVDMRSGGEIVFSTTEAVWSESLGMLRPGDVLSERGVIFRSNTELVMPFLPMPPVTDMGLDAWHDLGKAGSAFSVTTEFFSERLNVSIGRGDLLLSDGSMLRTARQLLEKFQPILDAGTSINDLGLDAVFIWPGGEIWFSTERGFQDRGLGPIRGGDLLSSDGYVVLGNLDLVAAFSPLEDLADFGLDALVIATDVEATAEVPVVTRLDVDPPTGLLRLEWLGQGRFFQVLGAAAATGPYLPLGPIQPDSLMERTGWLEAHPDYFLKVRQW